MYRVSKVTSTLMIVSIILGFASILPTNAANGAVIFVDPKDNIFPPPSMGVGDTFTVNVSIANITGLGGLSYKLSWNATLLELTTVTEVLYHTVTPEANWDNIWSLKLTKDNVNGVSDYAQTWQDSNAAVAAGYAPANVTMANFPPEGKLAAAMYTFKIKQAPTRVGDFVTCALDISDVKPGDLQANPIPITTIDGVYTLNFSPPTELPFFSVEPPTYTASAVGEKFNISIKVNNLEAGWEAVGFEFKLGYDPTILKINNVYEGPFLPPFGAPPNQGTLFMVYNDPGFLYVQAGDVVLPDANGTWHGPFPSGEGVLAIIEFESTAIGEFPTVLSCPLDLYATKVANWQGGLINQTDPIDGFYSIRPKVTGRVIDVYVCSYPDDYNGAGQNVPSDMFWPQKEVCLCANVSYNEWPEQMKDVAFEIFDPHGVRWGLVYARTNEFGTARTCFRLPWPCDDPEYYMGKWTVVGTVDIACIIVNDTLEFHYDYLVRIWKVTAEKTSYKHGEQICVTIEFGSHAQQLRNVTLAVTGLDNTGVPFAFVYKQVQIGGATFCSPKNFTEGECVTIPKWARAGGAEIDVAFLDLFPFEGGTVQSGYFNEEEIPIRENTVIPAETWLGYFPLAVTIEAA